MRKYILAVLATAILAGCKKEETTENVMQTKSMPIKEISIVNGMLSFNKAEFYDNFVSGDEEEVLAILRQYEENSSYLSLAEQREWAEDTVYTELISSLLNQTHMIHIENKVYRINAATGSVYTLPAEYINDVTAMTALKNEDITNELISAHSVEEDLWEISGLPVPKGGPGSGCPTIPASTIKDNSSLSPLYSTVPGCSAGNTPFNAKLWTYLRYYRYGILFELLGRSRETDVPNLGGGFSCNSITLNSPTCTFKRNHSSYTYNLPPKIASAKGEVRYKPYSGGNRLCWFYWTAKTTRSAVGQETPLVSLLHNYTP